MPFDARRLADHQKTLAMLARCAGNADDEVFTRNDYCWVRGWFETATADGLPSGQRVERLTAGVRYCVVYRPSDGGAAGIYRNGQYFAGQGWAQELPPAKVAELAAQAGVPTVDFPVLHHDGRPAAVCRDHYTTPA
jgi:hypothetical protein